MPISRYEIPISFDEIQISLHEIPICAGEIAISILRSRPLPILKRPPESRFDPPNLKWTPPIDTKLSASGEDALQTHAWGKRAVKGPKGAVLQPYVDEMSRVVKRAINRSKKPKAGPPTPSPAPQGQSFMAIMPQRPAEDSAADAPADDAELPESYYKAAEDEE